MFLLLLLEVVSLNSSQSLLTIFADTFRPWTGWTKIKNEDLLVVRQNDIRMRNMPFYELSLLRASTYKNIRKYWSIRGNYSLLLSLVSLYWTFHYHSSLYLSLSCHYNVQYKCVLSVFHLFPVQVRVLKE